MSDLAEKIERIDKQGISKTPLFIRERLLKNLDIPLDRHADVAVITGCNSLLRPLILVQLANILTKLNINFTFLSFEHCCFSEVVRDAIYKKEATVPVYEEQARTWIRRNCANARDLGAHIVVNLCGGCNTSYLRHATDLVRPIYYINYFQQLPFTGRLDLHIDLYEGCHKLHNFYPECQTKEENTIALLGKIQGLTFSRILGSICCRKAPDQVLKRATSPLLVAPSFCCYTGLRSNSRDKELKVGNIIEILERALD